MIDVLTEICNSIWRTEEWPMYSVADYYTPSKGNEPTALPELKKCQPRQSFEQSHTESHLE